MAICNISDFTLIDVSGNREDIDEEKNSYCSILLHSLCVFRSKGPLIPVRKGTMIPVYWDNFTSHDGI
ncbi:hypothetical protein, partial [Aquicella lusitana]|uniref:hypothetical protein n=1 Tax=Aquicella lusitana TaxID=254246 RepID=UPI001B876ACC